ncbi:PfkB family carbohydrate kinase [Paramicrobacterium agarici]|uniref:PfkB family carbohydrate kinase n=1 Tax=Paramicrobacterium agarici TaxID=630514 RepID=UPI001151371C|nr:PfkB family carbohydrate kinase [Microbacterium agarici]TQO21367.1 pyridoxal kinase [Microbacterium agarici]
MSDVTVLTSGWEMDRRPVDAVVISSQVAYGAVGNTATVRVLTEAGYRCVHIPTVILGTLPHYDRLHGGPLPDEWLAGILDDLLELDALDSVKYVLVGYLAHPEQARMIASWFTRLRDRLPDVRLVVDPAMGDDDVGMYTEPAVAASYGEHLLPLAAGLTPNRFELGLLTDAVVDDAASIAEAASRLCSPDGWVIVTSAGHSADDSVSNLVVTDAGFTTVEHARITTHAKGAGDIFAATVVVRLLAGDSVEKAAEFAGIAVADAIRSAETAPG